MRHQGTSKPAKVLFQLAMAGSAKEFSESMHGKKYSFTVLHDSYSDFQESGAIAVLLDERER